MSDPIKRIVADLKAQGKKTSEEFVIEKMKDPDFRDRYFKEEGKNLGYDTKEQFEADLSTRVKEINPFTQPIGAKPLPKPNPEVPEVPTPVVNKGAYQFEQEQKARQKPKTEVPGTGRSFQVTDGFFFGEPPAKPIPFYEADEEVVGAIRPITQEIDKLKGYRDNHLEAQRRTGVISSEDQKKLQQIEAELAKNTDLLIRTKAQYADRLPIEYRTPSEVFEAFDHPYKAQVKDLEKQAEEIKMVQSGDLRAFNTLSPSEYRSAAKADPNLRLFQAESTKNKYYLEELGRASEMTMSKISETFGEDIWKTLEKAQDTPDQLTDKDRAALEALSQDSNYQRLIDQNDARMQWNDRTAMLVDKYPSVRELQEKGLRQLKAVENITKDNPIAGDFRDYSTRLLKGIVLNSAKAVLSNKITQYEDLAETTLGIPEDGPLWATSSKFQKPFRTKVADFTDGKGNKLQAHYTHDGQFVGTYDKGTGLKVSTIDPNMYDEGIKTKTNWSSGAAMGTEVLGDLAVTVLLTRGAGSIGTMLRPGATLKQQAALTRWIGTPAASFAQYNNRWVQQGLQEGMTIDQATNYSLWVSGAIAIVQPLYGFEAKLAERLTEGMWKGITPATISKAITNPSTLFKKFGKVLLDNLGETAEESFEQGLERYVVNNYANKAYGTNLQTKYKDFKALQEDFYEIAFVTSFATGPLSAITQITDKSTNSALLRKYMLAAAMDPEKYKVTIGELRNLGKLDNTKNYYEEEVELIYNRHKDELQSDQYTEEAKKDIVMLELKAQHLAAKAAAIEDPNTPEAQSIRKEYDDVQETISNVVKSKKGLSEQGLKESKKQRDDVQLRKAEKAEEKQQIQAEEQQQAAAQAEAAIPRRKKILDRMGAKKGGVVAPSAQAGVQDINAPNIVQQTEPEVVENGAQTNPQQDVQEVVQTEDNNQWEYGGDPLTGALDYSKEQMETNEPGTFMHDTNKAIVDKIEKDPIGYLEEKLKYYENRKPDDVFSAEDLGKLVRTYQKKINQLKANETQETEKTQVRKVKKGTPSVTPSNTPSGTPSAAVEFTGAKETTPQETVFRTRASNAAKFLNKLGFPVKVVVHSTEESFYLATGTSQSSGVYLDGTIHLNETAALDGKELNSRAIHEAWHPVLEHIRVADPKLYNQIRKFMFDEVSKNPYLNKKIRAFAGRYARANAEAVKRGEKPPHDVEEEAITEFLTEVSVSPNILTAHGRKTLAKSIAQTFKKFAQYFIGSENRNLEELGDKQILDIISAAAKAFSGDFTDNTINRLVTTASLQDFKKRPERILDLRDWAVVAGTQPGEGITLNGQPATLLLNTPIGTAATLEGVVYTPDGKIENGRVTPYQGIILNNPNTGFPTIEVQGNLISFVPAPIAFKRKDSLVEQKPDGNDAIYSAIYFDKESLLKSFPTPHKNVYAHHSTIEFKPKTLAGINIGEEQTLRITGRITTDRVDALLVENPLSANKHPHITLSTTGAAKIAKEEIANNLDKIVPIDVLIIGKVGITTKNGDFTEPTNTSGKPSLLPEFTPQLKANGDPKIYYHSSDRDFTEFKGPGSEGYERSHSLTNKGIYFHEAPPLASYGKNRYEVQLDIQNPFIIDNGTYISETVNPLTGKRIEVEHINSDDIQFLQSQGYDAVSAKYPAFQTVVFDPSQVKIIRKNGDIVEPTTSTPKHSLLPEDENLLREERDEIIQIQSQSERDEFIDDVAALYGVEPIDILVSLANMGVVWQYRTTRLSDIAQRHLLGLNIPVVAESFYTTNASTVLDEEMSSYVEAALGWGSPGAAEALLDEAEELIREPKKWAIASHLLNELLLQIPNTRKGVVLKQRASVLQKSMVSPAGQVLETVRGIHNIIPSLTRLIGNLTVNEVMEQPNGMTEDQLNNTTNATQEALQHNETEVAAAVGIASEFIRQRTNTNNQTLVDRAISAVRGIFSTMIGKQSLLANFTGTSHTTQVEAVADMMTDMINNGQTGAQTVYATLKALQKVNGEFEQIHGTPIYANNEELLAFFRAALGTSVRMPNGRRGTTRVGAYLNQTSPYHVDLTELNEILNYEVSAQEVLKKLVEYVYSTNNVGGKTLSEEIMSSPFFTGYTLRDAIELQEVVASQMQKTYGERVKSEIATYVQKIVQEQYFGKDSIKFQGLVRTNVEKIVDAYNYGMLTDDSMKALVAAMYLGDENLVDTVNRLIELSVARSKTSSSIAHRKIDKEASWLAFKAYPARSAKFFVNLFAYMINGLLSGMTTLYAATLASMFVTGPRIAARSAYQMAASLWDVFTGHSGISPFAFIADFVESGQLKELFKGFIPNLMRNDSRADHTGAFFGDSGINTMGSIKLQSGVDRALSHGLQDMLNAFKRVGAQPTGRNIGNAMLTTLGTIATAPLRVVSVLKAYEQAVASIAVPYLAYTEALAQGRKQGLSGQELLEFARDKSGFGNIRAAHSAATREMLTMASEPSLQHMFKLDAGGNVILKNGLPVTKLRYSDLYGSLVQDQMLRQADNDYTVLGEYIYKDMQMMGQPEGSRIATGFLDAATWTKPQILQDPQKRSTGRTNIAIAKSFFGYALFPFARIMAQTISVTYRYSVFGAIHTGIKLAFGNKETFVGEKVAGTIPKPFLGKTLGKLMETRVRSNAELYEQFLVTTGAFIVMFGHMAANMFDWDEDEIKLSPDRDYDVTFRLTGNYFENTLKDPSAKTLSYRFRNEDGSWGEWHSYKFAMLHIPFMSAIGAVRDELTYGEDRISGKDAATKLVSGPVFAMLEQTFAMTLNTMTRAANELTWSSKKEGDETARSAEQILKTMMVDVLLRSMRTVASAGNFSRDVYADMTKAGDAEGGFTNSQTESLSEEALIAIFKDSPIFEKWILGDREKVYDSFGNLVPREFKIKQLAEMTAQGITGPIPLPLLNTPFGLSTLTQNLDLTPVEDAYLGLPEWKLISKYPRVSAPVKYRVPDTMQSGYPIIILSEETKKEVQMEVAHIIRDYMRENYDELNTLTEKQLEGAIKTISKEAIEVMRFNRGYFAPGAVKPPPAITPLSLLLQKMGKITPVIEGIERQRTVEEEEE